MFKIIDWNFLAIARHKLLRIFSARLSTYIWHQKVIDISLLLRTEQSILSKYLVEWLILFWLRVCKRIS